MKMNMRQIIAIVIAALMLLGLLTPILFAFASSPMVEYIYDFAKLFTAQEADELDEKTRELMDRHGLDIVILTMDVSPGVSSRQHADDFYIGTGHTDGVMLYINMAEREVHFLTFGAWEPVFRNNVDFVLDSVTPLLSDGDYIGAAEAFLDAVNIRIYLSSTIPVQPQQTGPPDLDLVMIIGRSLLIGVIAGALVLSILLLVHGRSLPSPPCYRTYLGGNVSTKRHIDKFLRTHTSRVALPKNTSSGGGRGGGIARGGGGRKF
jgi:uncharacterized membrane protein YgcG